MPIGIGTMAAIGAGASVLSGLVGAGASIKAANKNLQGVRETNEANLNLAREEQAFNERMWNASNEYNTPENQLARWRAAGFSPHSFQPGVGDTQPLESVDLSNQQTPPDLSAYYGNAANSLQVGINNAMNYAFQTRALDQNDRKLDIEAAMADVKKQDLQSQIKYRDNGMTQQTNAMIEKLQEEKKLTAQQTAQLEVATRLAQQQFEQNIATMPLDISIKEKENALKQLEYTFNSRTMQLRIDMVASQLGCSKAQAKLYIQQAAAFVLDNKEREFTIETQGLRMSMLRAQNGQINFDFDFAQNYRYQQMRYQQMMQGIHALTEVGNLGMRGLEYLHPTKGIINKTTINENYGFGQ